MGTFLPSLMDAAKVNLDTILTTRATVDPHLNLLPVTQEALLLNQTANVTPIRGGAGEACVSLKVYYYQADNTTIPTGSATAIASDCELTTGNGVGTEGVDYDLNFFLKQSIKLNDKKCDQLTVFAEDLAYGLANEMHLMCNSWNQNTIAELEANKSVAYAGGVSGVDNVTLTGGEYTITGAEYLQGVKAADTLATLDLLADVNGLPSNYMIISGRSLKVSYDLAQTHRVNDNEHSYALQFGQRKLYNDVDFLDATVGAECIYLVDPAVIMAYFHSEYPSVVTPTDDENNTFKFSLELQYYDQHQQGGAGMRPLQFINDGRIENARIDVRYQKKCNSVTNKYGKPSTDHIWELDLCAFFEIAPSTDPQQTGIIRVNKAL